MIKYFSLSVLLLLYSSFMYSTQSTLPILIRSSKTTMTEFLAYSKTEPVKTYAQYLLDKNRKKPRPIKLSEILKQAQEDFLSHEPERSKKSFSLITEHIHAFDWTEEERKIIFYSLLRLAQLERNEQKKRLLLQEASVFSLDIKLDLQVFPPPLVKLYLDIKKKNTFISLNLKKVFPGHEIILINGKVYSHTDEITLPYGMYRVTAFSSSHTNWSQNLSLSRLMVKRVTTASLVNGSCKEASINIFTLKDYRILFPNFCIWHSMKDQLAQTQKKFKLTDLKQQPDKKKQWYEEELLWVGAALVLAAGTVLILSIDKDNDETKEDDQTQKSKPLIKVGF